MKFYLLNFLIQFGFGVCIFSYNVDYVIYMNNYINVVSSQLRSERFDLTLQKLNLYASVITVLLAGWSIANVMISLVWFRKKLTERAVWRTIWMETASTCLYAAVGGVCIYHKGIFEMPVLCVTYFVWRIVFVTITIVNLFWARFLNRIADRNEEIAAADNEAEAERAEAAYLAACGNISESEDESFGTVQREGVDDYSSHEESVNADSIDGESQGDDSSRGENINEN